jgi:two-component system cell cycle sensor histidine kinase/response regulator CckA
MEAANETLERTIPDLMITELLLPDGDGLELLRAHAAGGFPMMVVTGHGDQRAAVRAVRAGALDYVIKSAAAFEAMPQIILRVLREWWLMEERGRLEDQLRQSQRMEAIGRLAGGIAHDFNNLLTIIGSHLELIQSAVPDHSDVQESASEILKAHESASTLTRQMLAFGGKQIMEPVVADLNHAVRNVSQMLRRVIGEEYQLELRLTDLSCPVEVEPASFEQVVINLVVNARDAMPEGGRLILTTEHVSVADPLRCAVGSLSSGEYVRLGVIDQGHGMEPAVMARIFDPFFTTKPRGRGTGLGLPSSLGIIRQFGGNVTVESTEHVGSMFHVYLPLSTESSRSFEEPAPTVSGQGSLTGSETILVAEDDTGIRSLVQRMLQSRGYDVLTARDGEDAIAVLERLDAEGREVNLLVTDVVMPKASGPEVARRLSELHPEARVVFMSGYVDDRLAAHRLDPLRERHLSKPFTSRALCETVRDILDTEPQITA